MFRKSPTAYLIAAPGSDELDEQTDRLRDVLDAVSVELVNQSKRQPGGSSGDFADAFDRADMVIADVSAAESNPNMMFELGVARGARKPILVLSREGAALPSDLMSLQVITYKAEDTEKVMEYVKHWALEQSEQITG